MRHASILLLLAALTPGCDKKPAAPAAPAPAPAPAPAAAPASPTVSGKLLERLDAASYSYLRIQTAQGEVWAAVPQAKLEKGAEVAVVNAMPMGAFESKTLNKKFDNIYFGTLGEAGAAAPAPAAPAATGAKAPDATMVEKLAKAPGAEGRSVDEIHAQKAALKDKTVAIHGKVVKASMGVMGKNWLHLRDGSGDPEKGTHDLTVTTQDDAKVGDVIVVKGVLHTDKDFGSGYRYAVIVEDAKIQKK
jgi:hypothetical protein